MNLSPREKDKLMIAVAAMVAADRKKRGVKLNHPEAIALISNFDFTQATRLQVIHHSNSNQSRFCFFLKKGLNFLAWIKFLTYVCKQRMQ